MTFDDVAVGAWFTYYGKPYHKVSFSMAHDAEGECIRFSVLTNHPCELLPAAPIGARITPSYQQPLRRPRIRSRSSHSWRADAPLDTGK
jgi:hypothetical protein